MIAKVIKKLVKSLLLIYFSMKISLVGAGNIGGTLAHLAITKKLAQEVVILDIFNYNDA